MRMQETEDVRGQVAQQGEFADAEIELVRDEDFIRVVLRRALLVRCHFSDRAPKGAWSAYCDTQLRRWHRRISRLLKRKSPSRGASLKRPVRNRGVSEVSLADS